MNPCSTPEGKKNHDKEYQRVRRASIPEVTRQSSRRWKDSKLSPEERVKREQFRMNAPVRARLKQECLTRRELKKDLKLLKEVVSELRVVLTPVASEKPPGFEKERALLDYYENNRNEDRWLRYNQKHGAKRLAGILTRLYRDRRHELEMAARRVFFVKQTPEEKKIAKAVRRRLEKWRNVQKGFARALKCKTESRHILDLCGISLQGLRAHLESKFQPGMTWENYGFSGWHIDHIKPCSSFELDQKKECFHYTNLQPLWAADNMIKSDKFDNQEKSDTLLPR